MVGIDDRVASVKRVAGIADRVKGNNVVIVNVIVSNVDDKVKIVDDRVVSVNEKLTTVGDKVHMTIESKKIIFGQ